MTDLASLSFAIDSSQAKQAADYLTAMVLAANNANTSQKDLTATNQQFSQSLQAQLQSMSMWQFGLQQATGSLQLMITQMHAWEDVMTSSKLATDSFRDSINQVIAVASTFGQTAAGFETFVNTANRLKLSADQIPQALTRISAAAENQTPFGMQVRSVAQEYGAAVPQGGFNQSGDVLSSFVSNINQYRDTLQKMRDLQTVLGPMDAMAMRQLQRPDYVPLAIQAQRKYAQDYNVQADHTAAFVDQQSYANNEFDAQYQDLAGRYGAPFLAAFISPFKTSDRAAFSTRQQQLDYWQDLQRNGSVGQKLLQSNNPITALFDPSVVGTSNPLLNQLNYWESGQYGRNEQAIGVQFQNDRNQQGYAQAAWTALGRSASNLLSGGYTVPKVTDSRPLGPGDISAQQQALGLQLGQFGDTGYGNWAAATASLTALNAPGNGLGMFQRAYGDLEGARRFYNTSDELTQQQVYAQAPWQRQIDQTGQQAWLMSLAPQDRVVGQAFLDQAPGYNIKTSSLRPGTTLSQALNGPGTTDAITGAITGSVDQLTAQKVQQQQEQTQRDIDLQTQLQQVLTRGKAAADDFVKSWQAVTQVELDHGTQAQKDAAAVMALNDATAQRITIGKSLLVQIQQQTDVTKQQINIAADATNSNDPIQRAAAAYAFGVDNTTTNAILNGNIDSSQGVAYTAAQVNQLGNQGVLDATQRTNTQRAATINAQTLSGAAAGGTTNITYLQQSLQLQQQYNDDLAKAQAAVLSISNDIWHGNAQDLEVAKQKITAIQNQADAAQQLLVMQQKAAEQTKNYSDANTMEGQAQLNVLLANTPDSQFGITQQLGNLALGRMNDITMRQQTPDNFSSASRPYQSVIDAAAVKYSVPPAFLTAMLGTESGFDPNATNPSGATGIAQIMPGTAKNVPGYGPVDPSDPNASIMAMAAYLHQLQGASGQTGPHSWLTAAMQYKGAGSYLSPQVSSQAIADLASSLGVNLGSTLTIPQMVANLRPGATGVDPSLTALGGAATDVYNSNQALQARNVGSATSLAGAQFAAGLPFASAGLPNVARFAALGVGNPQQSDALQAANTNNARLGFVQGLTDANNNTSGSLTTNIAQAQQLAQAALQGNAALQTLTQTLQNNADLNQAAAMKEIATNDQQKASLDQYIASIKQKMALQQEDLNTRGQIKVNQQLSTGADQNALIQANIDIGPFASPLQVAQGLVPTQVRQQMMDDPTQAGLVGTSAETSLVQQKQTQLALQQTLQNVQNVRSGFDAMGSAITNSFANVITGTQNVRSALSGLLQDLIHITLQATVEKPLSNALSGGTSNLWNLLTGAATGYGANGLPTSGTLSGLSAEATANIGAGAAGLAAGGLFMPIGPYPVRSYARGGLFGGPTLIPAADGMILAGEAGPEAAMPLTRLANGDLGVKMSGGGGGAFHYSPTTVVHVNSGGGVPGGSVNLQQSKSMGDIIARTVQRQTDDQIGRHMQPGGLIYNAIRQNRGVA